MPRKVRGRRKATSASPQKRAAPKHQSPAATGPAGHRLEGQIGAQYLLALLGVGAPRGLPHVATVTSVAFQRAASGFPMDDVIVDGLLANGQPVTLELQAKRTVTFTASDKVFKDVVRLAVQASRKPEFKTQEYIVALAVGRTSTKIEQHVQTALRWARDRQDAATFFEHLQRPGFGDKEAAEFVATFRRHMDAELGEPATDADVWHLLRRFVVLPFDFEAPGSQAEQIALERCAMALATPDASQAVKLWDALVEHALGLDSTGGDATPESLKDFLCRERNFRLGGDRRWRPARLALAQASQDALGDIGKTVLGLRLPRDQALGAVRAALDGARYVEIHGAGGVGKSGVLATLAEELMAESHVVVLAPSRVPTGGWSALRHHLGDVDATPRQFLTDLAGDGGGVLFIDGLDRFDDAGERMTVKDLLRAAAEVPGFRVVATARPEFSDRDLRAWLPADALSKLGESPAVKVGELTDAEAEALASANQALADLLSPAHPATDLVRNLFRLERLGRIASVSGAGTPVSEAQMARQWWDTADGADSPSRRLAGQHLLRDLAVHALSSNGPIAPEGRHDQAVAGLMERQTLRVARHGHVEFSHDVLRDWALGCLLVDSPEYLVKLPLGSPAPVALARGVDMAARMLAEGLAPSEPRDGNGASGAQAFAGLLAAVSQAGAHGSWRRCVLLAMARTERSDLALNRCSAQLAANGGALLQELIGYVVAVDSEQGAEAWQLRGIELPPALYTLPVPAGRSWSSVIAWTLKNPQQVPGEAVPAVVRLYLRWGTFFITLVRQAAHAPLMAHIAAQMHTWLTQVEGPADPEEYLTGEAWYEAQRRPRLVLSAADRRELRGACLFWATADTARTENYLRVTAGRKRRRDDLCREMLQRADFTAVAAPGALADLFIAALCEDHEVPSTADGPFGHWDMILYPASPARRPFLELLRETPTEGLRLVRAVCAHAIQAERPSKFDVTIRVTLDSGVREFARSTSYLWSRGNRGAVLGSALMSLEAWGHERIERGDAMRDVLADVLGPDGSCAAFLAVAVDLLMTHVGKARDVAAQLAGSAVLLALDHTRFAMEVVRAQLDAADQASGLARPETPGLATKAWLQEQRSRAASLDRLLFALGHEGPSAVRDAVRQRLQAEAEERGPLDQAGLTANDWADPRVMALVGLHRLDPERYTTNAEGDTSYTTSDLERQLMEAGRDATWSTAVEVQVRLHSSVGHAPVDLSFLRAALDWVARAAAEVRGQATAPKAEHNGVEERRSATIAAMLVLRDGDEALHAQHGAWAHQQLLEAAARATARDEPAKQLQYNEPAIAGIGWLASLRSEHRMDLVQRLLELAARREVGLTNVLEIELQVGRSIDRRLGRSLMRVGLESSVFELRYQDLDDIAAEAGGRETQDHAVRLAISNERRARRQDARMSRAVQAELDWLNEGGPEPAWPTFPAPHLVTGYRTPRSRARHLPGEEGGQPTSASSATERPLSLAVDKTVAARWLQMGEGFMLPDRLDALRALLDHLWGWTALANGVGLEDKDLADVSRDMRDGWNAAYFSQLLAVSVADGAGAESCLHRAGELAPDAFFAAAAVMLHDVDQMWLRDQSIDIDVVRDFRVAIIDCVTSTAQWENLAHIGSGNVSLPMVDVIAAIFFGEFDYLHRRMRCYVLPAGMPRAAAFLPELTELAVKGARSPAVANGFLGLVGVHPQPQYLPHVAKVHAAWVRAHGADRSFWEGAAHRLCKWISAVIDKPADGPSPGPTTGPGPDPALITMVDQLVRVGSAEAQRLERRLGIVRPVGRG